MNLEYPSYFCYSQWFKISEYKSNSFCVWALEGQPYMYLISVYRKYFALCTETVRRVCLDPWAEVGKKTCATLIFNFSTKKIPELSVLRLPVRPGEYQEYTVWVQIIQSRLSSITCTIDHQRSYTLVDFIFRLKLDCCSKYHENWPKILRLLSTYTRIWPHT